MKRFSVLAALAAALVAAPAAAAPVEEVVTSGQVTGTLAYDKKKDGTYGAFRVKIVRAGQTLIDEELKDGCAKCFASPANQGAGDKSIVARDLDEDGEPEVFASLFTGGAHCCVVSTFYAFDAAAGGYRSHRRNWADAGYRLRDLGDDGTLEFQSADASFAYAFASYAESFLPVQVFRYRGGRLVDVTRQFRKLLRRDAKRALRLYRRYLDHKYVNVHGFLAGWVAAKYRLRQRRAANRFLRRELRRGNLRSKSRFAVGPSGRKYVKQLKRFLRKLGY